MNEQEWSVYYCKMREAKDREIAELEKEQLCLKTALKLSPPWSLVCDKHKEIADLKDQLDKLPDVEELAIICNDNYFEETWNTIAEVEKVMWRKVAAAIHKRIKGE